MKSIEVCFSPVLYPYILNKENNVVVIIDVLRATTSICTAFDNGVEKIIPVADVEDARKYKEQGYTVAAERNGLKLDFADFGNSPFNFNPEQVKGKTIVYSTTNGTQAIRMAMTNGDVVICSFLNLSAIANWLSKQDKNVLILCSGWKNKFNLEDSVCAGALIEILIKNTDYCLHCDSATASLDLWLTAKLQLRTYMDKAIHRERLQKMGLDDVIDYCFTLDISTIVPILKNNELVAYS